MLSWQEFTRLRTNNGLSVEQMRRNYMWYMWQYPWIPRGGPSLSNTIISNLYQFNLQTFYGDLQIGTTLFSPTGDVLQMGSPTSVVAAQAMGYEIMFKANNASFPEPVRDVYIYTTPDKITGWKIYQGPGSIFDPNSYAPMTWELIGNTPRQLKCLKYTFPVDFNTNPQVALWSIDGDDYTNNGSTPYNWNVYFFDQNTLDGSINPTFDTELLEIWKAWYGGTPTITSTWDGGTGAGEFVITVSNAQFIPTLSGFSYNQGAGSSTAFPSDLINDNILSFMYADDGTFTNTYITGIMEEISCP